MTIARYITIANKTTLLISIRNADIIFVFNKIKLQSVHSRKMNITRSSGHNNEVKL